MVAVTAESVNKYNASGSSSLMVLSFLKIMSFAEARQLIDDYIYFYNHQRIQLNTKPALPELRSQFVARFNLP